MRVTDSLIEHVRAEDLGLGTNFINSTSESQSGSESESR